MPNNSTLVWLQYADVTDISSFGEKAIQLADMTQQAFPIAPGFIISSQAYVTFLKHHNLQTKIYHLLTTINFQSIDSVQQVSGHIKKLIMDATPTDEFSDEVFTGYRKLGGMLQDAFVNITACAIFQNSQTHPLAQQEKVFFAVKGEANLILTIKQGWAALFDPHAMRIRHEQKVDHFKVASVVIVQQMLNADAYGSLLSVDPLNLDKNIMTIEANVGLPEDREQTRVTPDVYQVAKSDLQIVNKTTAIQKFMRKRIGANTKEIKLSDNIGNKQKISDTVILNIAMWGKKIERHYYFPQHIIWVLVKNKVYILETKPITTGQPLITLETNGQNERLPLLLTGIPASAGIASGPVRIIHAEKESDKVLQGDIVVIQQANAAFHQAIKRAIAVVTETGGKTSDIALLARELGIPAVVSVTNATNVLKSGNVITVNGIKGEVYRGGHIQHALAQEESTFTKTATKIYVNLAQPQLAEKVAQEYVDGVGLLRAEYMISAIGMHPKKFIHDGKQQQYIHKLAEQIEIFCKAFSPRPVVYRTADFKTNEYKSLVGGKDFEPSEPNPMLGFRGAYRAIHDPQMFEMELEAVKMVRNKYNLKNLWIMLPFVRTVSELVEVKRIISSVGLYRSPTFKLWMMVETPANVILLDKFIQVGIDGVSIGSNDLTMLLLGTDRENTEVAAEFDEQNEAVLWALERVIKICHQHHITSSICGEGPSLYSSLLEKLVQYGITSISVSADSITIVRSHIADIEKKMGQ